MRKIAGYVRVSTEEQSREGISLDAQRARIEAYCAMRGLELVELVDDPGVSASKPLRARAGGQRLLDLLRRRRITGIVAFKLDRLFRNCADCLGNVEVWDRAGVGLHLLDLGGSAIDTSSATEPRTRPLPADQGRARGGAYRGAMVTLRKCRSKSCKSPGSLVSTARQPLSAAVAMTCASIVTVAVTRRATRPIEPIASPAAHAMGSVSGAMKGRMASRIAACAGEPRHHSDSHDAGTRMRTPCSRSRRNRSQVVLSRRSSAISTPVSNVITRRASFGAWACR